MLQEVFDKESELKPRPPAQTGGTGGASGTGGPNKHLAQDDLEAYVNGRLTSARLDHFRTHLDACDACRAELEDLRTFKSNAIGRPGTQSIGRELERRQRRRRLKASAIGAGVTVCVASIAALLWWGHGRWWASKNVVAASETHAAVRAHAAANTRRAVADLHAVADAHAAADTHAAIDAHAAVETHTVATGPGPAMKPVAALAVASVNVPRSVVPAHIPPRVATSTSSQPTTTAQLTGGPPTPAATAPVDTRFALLGPFGDVVSETRPEFSWQPLAGASHYSVAIVDEGLHPVQRSHRLHSTVWRPRRPLRRGHTYIWQVTATLRGGSKVVASEPLAARLTIAPAIAKVADK